MSLDLPINEPKINTDIKLPNTYEWIYPLDSILNLAICFLPGVKSTIIQNEKGIHIKISTYFRVRIDSITYSTDYLYKYIKEYNKSGDFILDYDLNNFVGNNKLPGDIQHFDLGENRISIPYLLSHGDRMFVGFVVMFYNWFDITSKLLSVNVQIGSKILTFRNISKKRYQDIVYCVVDVKNTIIPRKTIYSISFNFAYNIIDDDIDVYIYYIDAQESRFKAILNI